MSSNGQGSTAQRLAVAQHERRQAVFEAREAHGERPSAVPELSVPPHRDKLPTFDDLTAPGTVGRAARWKLVLALAAALGGLGELAREIVNLVGKH